MGTESDRIVLYSPQADAVWEAVEKDGIAYSRREYVRKKYEESAGIFLAAYDAYVREAERIVPRPVPYAYPYWAFASTDSVDPSGGGRVMKLSVPADEAVFFDAYDWYRVLRLSYIGESSEDEEAFARMLQLRGIRDSSDAVLKPFYPDVKREITGSWKRIFRHDEVIRQAAKAGDLTGLSGVKAVQAGLWCIKKEWLI